MDDGELGALSGVQKPLPGLEQGSGLGASSKRLGRNSRILRRPALPLVLVSRGSQVCLPMTCMLPPPNLLSSSASSRPGHALV